MRYRKGTMTTTVMATTTRITMMPMTKTTYESPAATQMEMIIRIMMLIPHHLDVNIGKRKALW